MQSSHLSLHGVTNMTALKDKDRNIMTTWAFCTRNAELDGNNYVKFVPEFPGVSVNP